MQWPFRRQSNPIESYPLPTDLNGPVETPGVTTTTTSMSRGARIATIAIASVLLVLVVGLLGHWLYTNATHSTSPKTKPQAATGQPANNSKPAGLPVTINSNNSQRLDNGTSSESQTSSNATKSQQGSTSAPSQPSTTTSTTSGKQNLTNTGPGSTAAIFLATILLAMLSYQLVLRRRLQ